MSTSVLAPNGNRTDPTLTLETTISRMSLQPADTNNRHAYMSLFAPRTDLNIAEVRSNTFDLWPRRVDSSIQTSEMVRTGLYYTGDEDIVRCFSCKVQILNWQVGMDPMQVHRWRSPECEFLRTLLAEAGYSTDGREESQQRRVPVNLTQASQGSSQGLRSSVDTTLGDTRSENRGRGEELNVPSDNISVSNSDRVRPDLNVESNVSREPIEPLNNVSSRGLNVSRGGNNDDEDDDDVEIDGGESSSDSEEEDDDSDDSDDDDTTNAACASQRKLTFKDKSELRQENARLRRTIMCRKCHVEKVQTLFLPCRHLVTCEGCSEAMDLCIFCKETILGTVRTFLT